jgi:hypothetical protein
VGWLLSVQLQLPAAVGRRIALHLWRHPAQRLNPILMMFDDVWVHTLADVRAPFVGWYSCSRGTRARSGSSSPNIFRTFLNNTGLTIRVLFHTQTTDVPIFVPGTARHGTRTGAVRDTLSRRGGGGKENMMFQPYTCLLIHHMHDNTRHE